MISSKALRAIKAPGLQAQRLLAQNEKMRTKIDYYQLKLTTLRNKSGDNLIKARDLLAQERINRKYKVD